MASQTDGVTIMTAGVIKKTWDWLKEHVRRNTEKNEVSRILSYKSIVRSDSG